MQDTFWSRIDAALDRIEAEKPDTFEAVAAILKKDGNPDRSLADSAAGAFFAGSGGDRQLMDALYVAGWRRVWSEASYHYEARHIGTGHILYYCEGDVYQGGGRLEIADAAPWWVMNVPCTRVLSTHATEAEAETAAEAFGSASFPLYAPEYKREAVAR